MEGRFYVGGHFPPELIEEIRDRTDIVNLIESYLPLKRQGRNFTALCPFHLEDTPSFSVSPDKQMFYCFGCQKGGGAIDFVMEFEHLSFPEAVEKLANRAGIALPERELTPREKKAYDQRKVLHSINSVTASFYHEALQKGGEASAYLAKRGISAEMIEKFQLGYATPQWEDLKLHLKRKEYQESEMLKVGVVTKGESGKSYDRFRNRLMFPIADAKGKIIAFGGRVLDDSLPKYLNSAENPLFQKSRSLYGLNLAVPSIREREEAVIMEGYLDVISAHQFGVTNALAPLGTAFTEDQAKLLKRYTKRVVLAYDGDNAGRKAALRSLDILAKLEMRCAVMVFPEGCDPDDYLRRYGREEWDALRSNAPSGMEYRIEIAFETYDSSRAEGKADIVEFLTPALLAVKDMVERTEYIRLLSRKLDIDADLLLRDLRRKTGTGHGVVRDSIAERSRATQGLSAAHRYLFRYAVEHAEAFDEIESLYQWNFIDTSPEREIIALIREHRTTFQWNYQHLADLAAGETRESILAYAVSGREQEDNAAIYADCLNKLKKEQLKIELKDLEEAIKNAHNQDDSEELASLLRKFSKIQQELRKK